MDAKILKRIETELGVTDAADRLAGLSPSDLQSLWLELSRRQAAARSPGALLVEWERNRFVRPAEIARGDLLEVERRFLAELPETVSALQLSPLAPLGSCAAVATVSQHKIVSAERGTEVLSDPTNVLALEAASRRRALLRASPRSVERVQLATVSRVVRAQPLGGPGHSTHFSLAAVCTAGRDQGSSRFELETLVSHLAIAARFVSALGVAAEQRILLTPLDGAPSPDALRAEVKDVLEAQCPDLEVAIDPDRESGRSYYRVLCFKHRTRWSGTDEFEFGDGGFTDWTSQLLSDRKERLAILGCGLERVAAALDRST